MVPAVIAAQEVSMVKVVVPEWQVSIVELAGLAARVHEEMVQPLVPVPVNASVAVIVVEAPFVTVLDTVSGYRSDEQGYCVFD